MELTDAKIRAANQIWKTDALEFVPRDVFAKKALFVTIKEIAFHLKNVQKIPT